MKDNNSTEVSPTEGNVGESGGILQSWTRFWFASVPPTSFHVVRVFAGIVILVWMLSFIHQQVAFLSLQGIFDTQAHREATASPEGIRVPTTWSVFYGLSSPSAVHAYYWSAVVVAFLFALGIAVRLTGVLTWLAVASFMSNPVIDFGGDHLVYILTFYLALGYLFLGQLRDGASWWSRLLGPRDACVFSRWLPGEHPDPEPTNHAANWAIRLIQLHFAIVIVTSGLHKLQFGHWWSGFAFNYPLHPPFETTDQDIRQWMENARQNLFFASAAVYAFLAWQIAFPLFAWRRGLRWLLLGGAVVGWLGCVLIYDTPIYGPVYSVAVLAFVTPDEWHALGRRLGGLFSNESTRRTSRRAGKQQTGELVGKS